MFVAIINGIKYYISLFVQNSRQKGIAVREYLTSTDEVDYLIFINEKPVGVIETKEENK